MYVFYGKRGPADQTEYCYSEIVHVKDRIAVVQMELTREYMLTLGYELLGEIEQLSELPDFLKTYKDKETAAKITTPLKQVQPEKDDGTDISKTDVSPLPNPDPMSQRLPDTEASQKQWWQ